MAIAKVGTDTSNTTDNALTYSFSHTLVSGSNRMVAVYIGYESAVAVSISSITYGGVSMTEGDTIELVSGPRNIAAIYYILETNLPSDGSNTVAITLSGTVSSLFTVNLCAEYTGVYQGTPVATDTNSQTSGATITNTISPASGAWVLSVVAVGNSGSSFTHNNGQVELLDDPGSGTGQSVAFAELRGASGETSLSSTATGSIDRLVRIAVSFDTPFTPLNPVYAVHTQINSGAAGAVSPYIADTGFSGGTTTSVGSTITIPGALTNPAPMAVYQSERYGNNTYTFTGLTVGATYLVRLHHSENYWTGTGQRVFSVAVNGSAFLTNFDIYAVTGGQFIANIEETTTTADGSGNIAVVFTTVTDNALSMGIELYSVSYPLSVNVSGTFKQVPYAMVNVSGTWRSVTNVYTNVAGTWKEV